MKIIKALLHVEEEDYLLLGQILLKERHPEFRVEWVRGQDQFLSLKGWEEWDLVIGDTTRLPISASDLARRVRDLGITTPLVLLVPKDRSADGLAAVGAGAEDFLIRGDYQVASTVRILRTVLQRAGRHGREREAHERRYRQGKLESLGALAEGIAVDFNNILQAILGNCRFALEGQPSADEMKRYLEGILKSGLRAEHMVKQLLAYSGKGRFLLQDFDLVKLIEDNRRSIEGLVGRRARFQMAPSPRLPQIEGDPRQVRQVVHLLLVNAMEAVPETGGQIEVKLGLEELGPGDLPRMLLGDETTPGRFLSLEVSDNGPGVRPDLLSRVFDPYVSTRARGRGVGLATVLGIVRGHRGVVDYRREGGRTIFRVYLPVQKATVAPDPVMPRMPAAGRETISEGFPSIEDALNPPPAPAPTVPENRVTTAGKTVLIVDDDEEVLSVASMMIRRFGFEVVTAGSGPMALDIFGKQGKDIALVLLDVKMPGMGGEEVFDRLRALRADLPILIASGLMDADVAKIFEGRRASGIIQKPYKAMNLIKQIREALG